MHWQYTYNDDTEDFISLGHFRKVTQDVSSKALMKVAENRIKIFRSSSCVTLLLLWVIEHCVSKVRKQMKLK